MVTFRWTYTAWSSAKEMMSFLKFQLAVFVVWLSATGIALTQIEYHHARFAGIQLSAFTIQFLLTVPFPSAGKVVSRSTLLLFLTALPVPSVFVFLSLQDTTTLGFRTFLWLCVVLVGLQFALLDLSMKRARPQPQSHGVKHFDKNAGRADADRND